MTDILGLFPQGLASGEAFYNRKQEREKLKNSFLNNEHTVIVAPRRYGKTSLIKQTLLDVGLPGKRIDLLPATNILFVEKAIKSCVGELINQIIPKTKQIREKLITFTKELHPKLILSLFGQKLEITTSQSPESSIVDLLDGLNSIAQKVNKRVVICFDEFQQVGSLKNHLAIEASIRHAAEESSQVTYVFSGSSRHLLNQMFSSKSKPLYHLCNLMELDRIEMNIYVPILLKRAAQRWKTSVDEKAIVEILNLTKCHPYYVNALCRQLWKMDESPTRHCAQKTWIEYIETQSNWITDDLGRLTPHQRNILAAIAYQPVKEPYGNEFSDRVKIATSSIKKSLAILIRNDFVYRDKDERYKILDPAIEGFLHNIHYFDFLTS
ncbi:MAG TPA: hypothetical protein DIC51_01745 [Coxiellaceae bacterium]|nr:hypothetical protein [Coxiellaceae bacterium]